jgi:two-component system response regulator NreC
MTKNIKIRVMVVDDHPVLRQGLRMVLTDQPDFEIIGEASNGKEAVQMARNTIPDVILMDISLPDISGLEATKIIHSEFPGIRIIGLSIHARDDYAEPMIAAGACSYQSKSDTDLLFAAIRGKSDNV